MYTVLQDALGWGVRRRDGMYIIRGGSESTAKRVCKALNDLIIEKERSDTILNDFMTIVNEIQKYENDEVMREQKIAVARDMLQNMDIK